MSTNVQTTQPNQVAKWGQAFDMKVLGFDPVLPAASFKELNIQKADLDKIWPNVRIRIRAGLGVVVYEDG